LHPFIADAAVVPTPDEDTGEVANAFSVLRNPLTVEGVLTFVAARVSPHKNILRVEFVEQLGKGLWCWHPRQKSALETMPAARDSSEEKFQAMAGTTPSVLPPVRCPRFCSAQHFREYNRTGEWAF
jgi:hypothetical protein